MNKLEQIVYNTVKGNPKIKFLVRNIYQGAFDLLPKKKDFHINPIDIKEDYFFGFHDVTPFSEDDTKVLANKLTIPFRMPQPGDILEVGYFPFEENKMGEFLKIGESKAWNYHKGCRLQWVDEQRVIYNDYLDGKIISRIHTLGEKDDKVIPYPIDSVSADGNYAATFSYERLERLMGGYGYKYSDESYLEEPISANTGIFSIDLKSGQRKLLLSLQDLIAIGKLDSEALEKSHFVTHSLFSPDSKHLAFLHRWVNEEHTSKRYSRLLVHSLETGKTYVAPTDGMVSHYVWNDNNEIIAYSRVDGVDAHYLFKSPKLDQFEQIAYPKLNSDGHQSFIDTNSFITDTYPDKYRMAKIYRVDMDTNKAHLLASLNSPKKFQSQPKRHWACDLHPRMNRGGDVVCFDSVMTGKRALCTMSIKK